MTNEGEDLLICDFAEYYHIYDMHEFPLSRIAVYAIGLRDSSRIKQKINGIKNPIETVLTAGIYDYARILCWMQTANAKDSSTMPEMIAPLLAGAEKTDSKDFNTYASPDEFRQAWERLHK